MTFLIYMIHSGKTLGGSSAINGAAWTRGLAAQYDAWSQLLETSEESLNWNWDNLFGYMKKVSHGNVHFITVESDLQSRKKGRNMVWSQ